MTKRKKPAELTTEEAIKRLFPNKVIKEVKRKIDETHDHDQDRRSTSTKHSK